jgi:hypothetical protein
MPTLAQLSQKHPELTRETLADHRAIYEGGETFMKRVGRFLPKRPVESDERYVLRISEANYRNYTGPAIDYFASMLFSTRPILSASEPKTSEPVPDLDDYWTTLENDVDRRGTDLSALFKGALVDSMVAGWSWVRVHAPSGEAESRADFEAEGLGEAYLEHLPCESVIDWQDDGVGLEWAIVYSTEDRRNGVMGARDMTTQRWDVLYPDRVDTYEITHQKTKPPAGDTEIPLVSSMPHTFGRVPLVCLDLPVGLHVCRRLLTPQLAHFRTTNALAWNLASSCYAQPVFHLMDQQSVPKMGAGVALIMGAEEKVDWIAPPTEHLSVMGENVKDQKDEIFRIVHQMALGVDNNAASVGRSGESKQADAASTRVVLLAYSRLVKEAIERTLDLITKHRGESLKWSVEGLDDFAAASVHGLLEAMKLLNDAGGIPSETFNAEMSARAAEALLPDLDAATKQIIRKEIQAGIKKALEEESELAAITREVAASKAIPPVAQPKKEFPPS